MSAKLIQVIETHLEMRGNGKDDPVRVLTQYWSVDGVLLAEVDPLLAEVDPLLAEVDPLPNANPPVVRCSKFAAGGREGRCELQVNHLGQCSGVRE